LVVPLDDAAVYIDQAPSRHMVRMFTQIGTRAPLYCTAAGKAILAHRPEGEIEAYLAHAALEPRTAHTLTAAAALRVQLDQIRAEGYAVDEGEMEDGVRCVAAPIRDHTGHALAAISISGPAARFTGERIRQVLPALLEATADLSARLGYLPPGHDGATSKRTASARRR
jgi:IclR family acetate operon transcriptional repressor